MANTEKFAESFTGVDIEVFTDNSPIVYFDTAKLRMMEKRCVVHLAWFKYKITTDLGSLTGMLTLCPDIWWNA